MSREQTQVDLPDIPESEPTEQDEAAETSLTTADEVPAEPYVPQAVTPWQEDSGTVDLTGLQPGSTLPVADLPVELGVPEGADPATLAGEWKVDLAAPEASQTAGVAGLIMQVTPPATVDPAAEVSLSVVTTDFADLYGPQAADRFGLMLLPECVITSPDSGDCSADGGTETLSGDFDDTFEPVQSTVEVTPAEDASATAEGAEQAPTRSVVTGTVPVGPLLGGAAPSTATGASVRTAALPAVDSASPRVVGALDTGASAGGDFTATPLLSSGSWAAGSSSGAFTYSYQVQTPEVAGGLMPRVALSYSSQSVDGRTSATNNQASWIGDGWDYNPGFISRTYANCRQDAVPNESEQEPNNRTHRTADLCYGSENATLSLGGMTTELVWDKDKQKWFTANGDGSKIELKKNTDLDNGDGDGEHWVVTTRDGTRYHFGLHRLPGWDDNGDNKDDPTTDSVLTVPVYGNHPGEPCYKAGNWAGSHCTQAWRWGLDYVEDIQGNAMSLWWKRDTNHYARNFNFKAPVEYHRDGYLSHIDYGQRSDSIFSAPAPARVSFSVDERCYAEGSLACIDTNFTAKDPGKYRIWYDTPADLRCAAQQKCWNAGPSFWSRMRLDTITTSVQRQPGTTARQEVDEYKLTQSFSDLTTGPNTALWLESITRTGYGRSGAAGPKTDLNGVRFEAQDMPNRVKRDNRPEFARQRISRVINEYGGETVITYRTPTGECATGTGLPAKGDTAALKANDRFCYPVYWHPDAGAEDIDWFHKYVVSSVEELPNINGSYGTRTDYSYENPAWKLAEQEFTKKATRTYSRFAGVEKVTVLTGANDDVIGSKRSKAVTRYFRGMGGDVPLLDITGLSQNEIAKDEEPFAGRIAEELTYADAAADESDWLTRSVTHPEATLLAARERGTGLSPLRAWRVTEPRQVSYTKSSGTGDDVRKERVVETRTTHESTYGLPTQIEFLGDKDKAGDESCTRLEYQHEPNRNIIGLTRQTRTSASTCADATFDDLATLSSALRTAYDGKAYGTALTTSSRGLATQTWSLKADGSGFQSDGTTGFDAIGRVVRHTDPDQKSSTITYDPPTGQAFKVIERNSLQHERIQELDPGRGVALKTTDTNGHVSHAEFDPLGRLVKAWSPGRTPSESGVPDFEAVYTIPKFNPDDEDREPPYITTRARGHENRIETSVAIYDGLGRERQTQEQATGGGRLVTDTLYNSSGEVWKTRNAYYTEGAPEGVLFTPLADTAVPNATRYMYDGLGRVVRELPILNGVANDARATRYEYGADHSTVINPSGAASYRMYSDALGRTARLDTFTDAARTEKTSMRYTYDERGMLRRVTNSAAPDSPWTWTYDHRGRMVTATDPDTGTTRTTYDHRDRPQTVTNARNITVWTGYDELSRPKEQRLDSSGGTLLSAYTYDTAPGGKGLPASVARYTDGQPYTMKVGGYTDDYAPLSTTLTLPQTLADTWGLDSSYTYSYGYNDKGQLESATLPAVGGFDAEKIVTRFNSEGLPLSVSGKDWYGAEVVYSPYGQVQRSTLGAQPNRVWTQNTYDEASGALLDQQVYREQTGDKAVVGGNLVSKRAYGYDDAGNVTSIREHALGIDERQCFTYDPLGQLTKAWTSKNQEDCAPGPIGTDGTVNVSDGKDGSGYWQEYEYDLLGNRSKLTEKNPAGVTGKNAETTYTYGKDGNQPRTLTKVTKNYVAPGGAQVTAEAERLYELTGETKSVTSLDNGDKQELSWTYDGQVERITGQGGNGKSPYVGLADKCLDLWLGRTDPGQPILLHGCNASPAQSWTFTPVPGQADADLGTLTIYDNWCVQPTGSTAGSALQLQKCDGSAAQRLKRTAAGQLTHVASGLCLAVKDGAGVDKTPIVLTTCSASSTAQQWEPQNETRHIYGPDGSRLLTIQGRQATLNLGEAQVTVQKGGALVNTQRSYGAPGGSVMRYGNGNGAESLVALAGDHQGSPYAEVALSGDMTVRIRKQDPFGNQRGTDTVGVNMQTRTGFLGAVRDDASGYTPLGARLYDPVVGRFLSADPVLDLADPVQANGYAYAHNNPVTLSDPTGLAVALNASERAAALAGAGLSPAQVAQAQATMGKSLTSVILAAAWGVLSDFIGLGDAMACFGGDMWSCGSLILGAIPWTKLGKIPSVLKAIDRTISAIKAFRAAKKAAEAVLAAARAAEKAALAAKKAAIEKAKKAAQAAKKKAADKKQTTSNKAVNNTKKTGNPVQKQAQAKSNPKGSSASATHGGKGSGGGGKSADKPGGSSGGSSRSSGGSSGSGGSGKTGEGSGGCSTRNSFTPGTKVLMADGTTKPIEDVKAGDKVLATDPKTGETRVETVTAEIKGEGLKYLVKVVIDVDGSSGTKTAEVTATDGHPFWVPELGEWIDATDLRSGQWLRTSAGTHVQITAVTRWTSQGATVHNLTVSNVHTYYVLAGATPVLAHNCGTGDSDSLSDSGGGTSGGATRTDMPYRGDGETVLHGHGSWRPENGTVTVPEGTFVAFYGEHGFTISRQQGMRISGPGGPRMTPVAVAGPGDEIPNYTLAPLGPGFTFRNGSTVVEARTLLSDLLQPNMGTCHWAACRGGRNPR
ncbi:polymorphic toxin-type HINT domain-containing protein [Streptomyces peucetius]|uniref:Polymorphic toxin-type HINT domain-containing protein n=2 Tax=Streptomyces peucetius TaxID=1950 RepID=A0ABY6IHZ7_STRPE|nr:ricin-type beta-trefoil lectin domain protein [Streptomyces peucetius]UYQ66674.1 polymorphic toxin-type HINT domain-containing protein [Streptomyces peucetius]